MNIEMLPLPDVKVTLKMQCEDCGHVQTVKGSGFDGAYYFGSAYDWCDACDSGLPRPIEEVKVVE